MCAQMRGNYSYLKTAAAMEDKGETAILQFLLCLLLCLTQTGTSNSQCLDNLPQYGSRGTGFDVPRLSNNDIYIIPNYTFSCYGNVAQWGACVERQGAGEEYNITFSVYRPSDDPLFPDSYSPVGSNAIVAGTATDGCITLNVPVSDQISVEPGDVVGLSHDESDGPVDGIETDVTVSNITTWYNTLDNIGVGPPDCPFRPGPGGNFPNSAPVAPVITAVVGPSIFIPPHSTSSHSPVLSTPSPSHSTSSHSPVLSTPSPSHSTSSHSPVLSTPSLSHSTSLHSPVPSTPSPSHSTSSHSPLPSTPSPSTIPSPSSPTQDGGSTLSTSTVAGTAAGTVGVVIIILLITISIIIFKVKDTSTGELNIEMKSNECYTATTTTHSETYNAMELKNNEAYQSATNTVTMEQNEAYSGTVVGATQDVTYEEVDGLYEEV